MMKIKQYEKRNILILILLMIVAYAFLLIGVINSNPMHTTSDEFGGLVGAAHLAGLDWSGVISNSGYYGFGWYSLFFWLFKITDSPFIIYRTIIIVTALLKVLIIPIAYYILKNYLDIMDKYYLYSISFLMPFLHTSTVGVVSNEYILELLIWISMFLMCKSVSAKNRKQSILYTLLLAVVCFYSFFIHTRALTLIIALIIVYFVYAIIKKDRTTIIIIGGLPIFYIVSQKLIWIYQKNIYGVSDSAVRNGSVSVSNNFNLLDKDVWDVWFRMVIGMINTENIITGGLFIVGIVAFIYYLRCLIIRKHINFSIQGNMIFATSVLCIGATITAFLVSSWFEGMLYTWGIPSASNQYSYKGLMYVRYWNIYVPVFLLCTFSLLSKIETKKIIRLTALISIILHIIYIYKIVPLVQNNGNCASFLYGIGHYTENLQISSDYYLKCILISLSIEIIEFMLTQTKHCKYAIIISIVFMMSFHFTEQTEYNFEIKSRISSKIDASYHQKEELEKQGIDIGTIYLNDESGVTDNNWKIYSIAQFYFNRYTLQLELPKKMNDNDIIISTNKSNMIEKMYKTINCYVLDENEVWYTNLDLQNFEDNQGEYNE